MFDEPAVPGEDGCRLRNGSDLLKRFLAQLHTNLGKALAIAICELHATPDLLTENAILGYQVRTAKPELFVNRLGDRPEQFLPVHTSIILAKTAYMDEQYGRKRHEFQVEACITVEV